MLGNARRIQINPGIAAWLLDHVIRPRQHVLRNRQVDLLSRFQIDDQLELRRLLHWHIGRLRGPAFYLLRAMTAVQNLQTNLIPERLPSNNGQF
jgi:hypothetical protein